MAVVVFAYCFNVEAHFDLGECRMSLSCGDGNELVTTEPVQRQPGAPGKRGPQDVHGQKGVKGNIGRKGELGQSCKCINVDELKEKIDNLFKVPSCTYWITNSNDIFDIYPLGPSGAKVKALCDTSPPGGWTVIQYRFNGSIDFSRSWNMYKVLEIYTQNFGLG